MGEELYDELAKLEKAIGETRTPVRIYAPVGSHKELLAYLVRRLLENGANSSASSTASPTSRCRSTNWSAIRSPSSKALKPKRNPKIVLPSELFGVTPQQRRGRPERPVGARAACSSD